jgi:Na+-transporting NADH:ubiquinone oxidoreductase subunit NqrE
MGPRVRTLGYIDWGFTGWGFRRSSFGTVGIVTSGVGLGRLLKIINLGLRVEGMRYSRIVQGLRFRSLRRRV